MAFKLLVLWIFASCTQLNAGTIPSLNHEANNARTTSLFGGLGTHVLVDWSGIDTNGTTATPVVHRPVKDPNNPIIREDRPWEDRIHMFGSVATLPNGSVRLYYLIDGQGGRYNAVAFSDDGGNSFTKPNLGLIPWGTGVNRCVHILDVRVCVIAVLLRYGTCCV